MSSSTDIYANYFYAGMKVGVGIPTLNSEVFRDWARIHEMDDDLVFLQLSRDQLPVDISLHVGQIIELRGGKEDSGYSCRAIIVSEGTDSQILLRLIGEIVTDELREFYRIDAFLPVKYYVTVQQSPKELEKDWNLRREQRVADELMRKQQRWESSFVPENKEIPGERSQELEEQDSEDDNYTEAEQSWDTIIPLAANISGGGIRIMTHQAFEVGDYVPLEILVPTPFHIVDAVARVVSVKQIFSSVSDRENFYVSLKFINIYERDRDAIVNYISNIQLKRIRQLRMQFAFRDSLTDNQIQVVDRFKNLKQVAIGLILFCFVSMVAYYMWGYANNRPKHEIEEIFERGLKKYLQQGGR
jgi:hypothetical protein